MEEKTQCLVEDNVPEGDVTDDEVRIEAIEPAPFDAQVLATWQDELKVLMSKLPDPNLASKLTDDIYTRLRATLPLGNTPPLALLSADDILFTDWPEPVWAVPGLLPAGLTILAGKPKVGKSWLALQIALAIAAGGVALGSHVEQGPVLYLALEDPPRRLQDRMRKLNWPRGLPAEFMPIGQFETQLGDLRNGGGERLARQIELTGYRLVVIDTLSRAIRGDQNDVAQMTAALSPIQEMAQRYNCAVLVNDHHNKIGGTDAIADILGSTAKGAVIDTAWGLYKEQGKPRANLVVIGRDVLEQSLELTFDRDTRSWQSHGASGTLQMTERRLEILQALQRIGRAQVKPIAESINQDRSNTFRRLQDLVHEDLVTREEEDDEIFYELAQKGHELLSSQDESHESPTTTTTTYNPYNAYNILLPGDGDHKTGEPAAATY